jgi:hypothetical protein
MTTQKRITTLIAVIVTAFAVLSPASMAAAQSAANTGQALEIGPPVISISGDPGQTIDTNISLRDVSPSDLYVTGIVNDFEANGEDGTPKVILDQNVVSPYSFKTWVRTIPATSLKTRQIKSLKITIDIPANAAPGGYYGIVRFTGVPPDIKDTGVSLNASLGSLVFIKVNGQAKEEMSVTSFIASGSDGKAKSLLEGAPITFSQVVKNSGNTFEQPTGLVTVKDMFGKVVATIPVNEEKRLILSASTRKFDEVLDSKVIGSNKILFGKYTAELSLVYGGSATEINQKITVWIIPYKLIGLGIAVLIAAFFLFRFLIQQYNRRIVGRATGTLSRRSSKRRR